MTLRILKFILFAAGAIYAYKQIAANEYTFLNIFHIVTGITCLYLAILALFKIPRVEIRDNNFIFHGITGKRIINKKDVFISYTNSIFSRSIFFRYGKSFYNIPLKNISDEDKEILKNIIETEAENAQI